MTVLVESRYSMQHGGLKAFEISDSNVKVTERKKPEQRSSSV